MMQCRGRPRVRSGVAGGLALLAGATAWWWHRAATFALPGRLPVDRVVAELAAALPESSSVRQAPLAPRRGLLASAGPRDALIVAPGSRLPLRLRVRPEVVLAFSVGVEGDGREDRHAAGVRFRVLVDGVERFARVVNPAARRGDRVWFDEQVDLSGLYPPAHGVLGDRGQTLRDDLLTLPEAAGEHGITTVAVSANPLVSRGTNFSQGFETFVELEIETAREDGEVVKTPASAAAVNDVFLRWLRSNRARRFLAYLHYMEPHHPYTPPPHLRPPAPPGVRRRVAAGRLDPWQAAMRAPIPFQLPALELEYVRRLYEGEIRAWDEQLAELLRALDAFDLLRSTVVVVTADHGEAFQEHGR